MTEENRNPEEFLNEELSEEAEGSLLVDVYQTDDEISVRSAVAGILPDDLEINITTESVTIRGKREKEIVVEEKNYFYQECFWGTFSRSIILPQEIDPERSTATVKNGILTIRMPKIERQKAKKIKVKID
ncbi:MAG: Hsp20/alpha crystallin family protein [bacterium]|nr:Hsp20/alpha crystallin family protein [bacterium]